MGIGKMGIGKNGDFPWAALRAKEALSASGLHLKNLEEYREGNLGGAKIWQASWFLGAPRWAQGTDPALQGLEIVLAAQFSGNFELTVLERGRAEPFWRAGGKLPKSASEPAARFFEEALSEALDACKAPNPEKKNKKASS